MPESQSIIHLKSPFPYTAKPAQSIWHCIFEDEPDVLGSGARSDEDEVFYDPVTLERISFGALREQTKRVAHGLLNGLGLKEGDTVMVFSWNCIQYPSILLGTQAAKLVFTGGNPTYSASDLAYHISNSKARVVLCDKASAEITKQAVKDAKLGNSVRVLAITPYDLPGIRSVWSYITDEKLEPRAFKKGEEDSCAFICYSSGTTGRPKGCIITHQMIWTSQHIFPASWPHSLHETTIGTLPLYQMYGLYWLALKGVKWHGRTILLSQFEPNVYCAAVEKYRPHLLHLVPPLIVFFMQSPVVKKYDLSSVKYVISGAAPLGFELHEAFEKRFNCKVLQGYGMTETACLISVSRPDDRCIGYNGRLMAGMEGRIVDGELQLAGLNITPGYFELPEVSAEMFATDESGKKWLKTGDIVELNPDGHINVTDRIKELIKYKGFQVAPAQLEDYLLSHPDVVDAAVTAIDRPNEGTEVPRAYVQLERPSEASEAKALEILQFVNSKLAHFKHIRGGIVFVDAVPKSPSGKILRRVIKVDLAHKKPFGETFPKRSTDSKL